MIMKYAVPAKIAVICGTGVIALGAVNELVPKLPDLSPLRGDVADTAAISLFALIVIGIMTYLLRAKAKDNREAEASVKEMAKAAMEMATSSQSVIQANTEAITSLGDIVKDIKSIMLDHSRRMEMLENAQLSKPCLLLDTHLRNTIQELIDHPEKRKG